jgi:hypothetical protein
MRADRYLKKSRKIKMYEGNSACSTIAKNHAIAINSPARVKKLMANIAKIDWSNPYKDFIK